MATSVYIKDLRTDSVVIDHNAATVMTPASVVKTLTAATALLTLGPDFRFVTPVELAGTRSAKRPYEWIGDIVVTPSGDPTLGSAWSPDSIAPSPIDTIVSYIKDSGITSVSGGIRIDDTFCDPGPVLTWECEDIAYAYGAGIHGLNYADNCVRLWPAADSLSLPTRLHPVYVTRRHGHGIDVVRGAGSDRLHVYGTRGALSDRSASTETTNPDPTYTFATLLRRRLADEGISVGDSAVTDSMSPLHPLCRLSSPTLADISRITLKRSDNLFAEGMLRALAPGGTRSECIDFEHSYWGAAGVDLSGAIIRDGSGLTRANAVSAETIGALLEHMIKTPVFDAYLAGFPLSGIDGTMRRFAPGTALEGRLALKTGSLSGVQAYAGYHLDSEGRPTHVVVIMVRGFVCPRTQLRDAVAHYLLRLFYPN